MQTFIHGGGRLPEAVDAALAHYRHQIFVGQLGWQLPMADGRFERDQYDRDDTVYVVARDADGAICGCARLLPTTRPYLLKDVFAPLLMRGVPAPESPGCGSSRASRRVPARPARGARDRTGPYGRCSLPWCNARRSAGRGD